MQVKQVGRPQRWIGGAIQLEHMSHNADIAQLDLYVSDLGVHSLERLKIKSKLIFQHSGFPPMTEDQYERYAFLIYDSMEAPTRTFHTMEHLQELFIECNDPIQYAAISFHDIVYYKIDGGLSDIHREYLDDLITEKDGIVAITKEKLDAYVEMVMEIFGYKYGQVLNPFNGMNEFLSACIAVRFLMSTVPEDRRSINIISMWAKVAACIEATIPFRKADEKGRFPPEALFDRLEKVNKNYQLGWEEEEIVETVQRAADLGNRDVGPFSKTDLAIFLNNTWKLLPEANVALRSRSYYLNDLAIAVEKMTKFFENLDPETLYFSFRDKETKRINKRKTVQAKRNIDTSLTYLRCILVGISTISAVAMLSGGEAPRSLFMGDLPPLYPEPDRPKSIHLEDFFDYKRKASPEIEVDEVVLKLLIEGGEMSSIFETESSPIAAFLYSHIGDIGLKESLKYIINPMNETNSVLLLESLPLKPVIEILSACSNLAVTRITRIADIIETLRETGQINLYQEDF